MTLPFLFISFGNHRLRGQFAIAEVNSTIHRPNLFGIRVKGRAVKVKQVAEELGIRYVVEGSVRKTGEKGRYPRAEPVALVPKHKLRLTPCGRIPIHPRAKPVELCPTGY